jgi:hypothetical protein
MLIFVVFVGRLIHEIKNPMNNETWEAVWCKFQGISPPVERTEDDFDPGAKYHIPGNTPYIRYSF